MNATYQDRDHLQGWSTVLANYRASKSVR